MTPRQWPGSRATRKLAAFGTGCKMVLIISVLRTGKRVGTWDTDRNEQSIQKPVSGILEPFSHPSDRGYVSVQACYQQHPISFRMTNNHISNTHLHCTSCLQIARVSFIWCLRQWKNKAICGITVGGQGEPCSYYLATLKETSTSVNWMMALHSLVINCKPDL